MKSPWSERGAQEGIQQERWVTMRVIILLGGILLVAAGALTSSAPPPESRPIDIYSAFDGRWEGTFVGFDPGGKELYRIRVKQTYHTVDANTQKVQTRDEMPDGTVITGVGENVARRRPDGSLELMCRLKKSNGEEVEHAGRIVRGPDGDKQIIWHSRRPGRVETFREVVRQEGERLIYSIDGMGRYGETLILMHGRYRRP